MGYRKRGKYSREGNATEMEGFGSERDNGWWKQWLDLASSFDHLFVRLSPSDFSYCCCCCTCTFRCRISSFACCHRRPVLLLLYFYASLIFSVLNRRRNVSWVIRSDPFSLLLLYLYSVLFFNTCCRVCCCYRSPNNALLVFRFTRLYWLDCSPQDTAEVKLEHSRRTSSWIRLQIPRRLARAAAHSLGGIPRLSGYSCTWGGEGDRRENGEPYPAEPDASLNRTHRFQ